MGSAAVNERLLRAGEVAEALNVSPETVLRWTRRGELPAASPDRSTRPRPRQPHRRECTIRRDYVKSPELDLLAAHREISARLRKPLLYPLSYGGSAAG